MVRSFAVVFEFGVLLCKVEERFRGRELAEMFYCPAVGGRMDLDDAAARESAVLGQAVSIEAIEAEIWRTYTEKFGTEAA